MAKADTSSSVGMERADLRRLLKFATEEPVNAAFALGNDGKPIITLDRRKQARALEKSIKDGAPDSKTHRFGTVSVDPDDPKLARFVINRAASGMAKRLVIGLKGTGFTKVRILLEDGTDVEAAEGEDDETYADFGASGQASNAVDATSGPDVDPNDLLEPPLLAAGAGTPDPADASTQTDVADDRPADAASLALTLTALVKRMMQAIAADPSQKSALVELATDAQASLKRGDTQQAAAGIEILHQALDNGGSAAQATSPTANIAASDDADQGSDDDDASKSADDDSDSAAPAAAADSASADTDSSPAPAPDTASLTATLTALVKQALPLIAADPSQADALKGLMTQAQAALKSGDLDTAGGHVSSLQGILSGTASAPGATATPNVAATVDAASANAPAIAKARLAWVATRQRVEGDLGKLHGAFSSALKGHSMEEELTNTFKSRVDMVLDKLDEQLADKLDEINKTTDPTQRMKLVQDAHALLAGYQAHVETDETIALLDQNPFTPMSVQKTLTMTLSALAKAIR